MSDSLPEPRGRSCQASPPGGGEAPAAPARSDGTGPVGVGPADASSGQRGAHGRPDAWEEDVLGPGFQARRLRVAGRGIHDVATLVRHVPQEDPEVGASGTGAREQTGSGPEDLPEAPHGTVIYVHGWSDYFANPELARTVSAAGFRFYAVDLHGYGRALTDEVLTEPDIPGYAESMREYRDDLEAAVRAAADDGAPTGSDRIVWIGHSTGGLVVSLAALTAHDPPAGIALATPWIAPHFHDLTGRALVALLRLVPRRLHDRPLPIRVASHYFRSLSANEFGEWPLDARWRPKRSFPLTVGFLLAAHQGQLRLLELHRGGARAAAPVLLQISRRTLILPWWHRTMMHRDTVLDVRQVRRRIGALTPAPRVISYDGALHDVHRSVRPVRERTFADLRAWLSEIARRIDEAPVGEEGLGSAHGG